MSHDAGHVHGPTCGGASDAAWLDRIRWDENGLVPAIAQDAVSHRVLMMAWMNREALAETQRTGHAVYWSRSRQRLWRKGEESGNQQRVHEIRTDCDADVILLFIDQVGGVACHTGVSPASSGGWKAAGWGRAQRLPRPGRFRHLPVTRARS